MDASTCQDYLLGTCNSKASHPDMLIQLNEAEMLGKNHQFRRLAPETKRPDPKVPKVVRHSL